MVLLGKIKLFHHELANTLGKQMFYKPNLEKVAKTIEKTNFFKAKTPPEQRRSPKAIKSRLLGVISSVSGTKARESLIRGFWA